MLDEFRTTCLEQTNTIVVNGYFPGLTVKEILNSFIEGILDSSSSFSGLTDQLEFIKEEFEKNDLEACVIIHNIGN